MAKKLKDADAALVRVSHIAAVMQVSLTGDQAIALAKYHMEDPRAESLLLRAGKIAKMKSVAIDGGDLLRMAKFLA